MRLSTPLGLPLAAMTLASGVAGAVSFPAATTDTGAAPARSPAPRLRVVSGTSPQHAEAPVPAADRWTWPLSPPPRVVRLFSRPAHRYGPGHRGIDLAGSAGALVGAVDGGTVVHVGVVAGRGTVTLLHPSGLRSTYEPVSAGVSLGQVMRRGAALGRLAMDGSHCAPGACLHIGAIRDAQYVDPLALLENRRVRLLPLR